MSKAAKRPRQPVPAGAAPRGPAPLPGTPWTARTAAATTAAAPCCYRQDHSPEQAGRAPAAATWKSQAANASVRPGLSQRRGAWASHHGGYSACAAPMLTASPARRRRTSWPSAVDNTQRDAVYPQTADFTFYGGLYRGSAACICRRAPPASTLDDRGGPGFDVVTPAVQGGAARRPSGGRRSPAGPDEGQSVDVHRSATPPGAIAAGAVRPAAERAHSGR